MKKFYLLSLLTSSLLFAEDTAITTHSELSYLNSDGNTQSQSFAADISAQKSISLHTIKFHTDFIYAEARDDETRKTLVNKHRYSAKVDYDYSFNQSLALNYFIEDMNDKFSGYDNRFNTGPGLIYNILNKQEHTLLVQANVLYSRDDFSIPTSHYNEYSSLYAAFDYMIQLTPELTFKQNASYKSNTEDFDAYFVSSKTAIESKISDVFSLGSSYKVDYINQKVGRYHTDRIFLLSLILDY